jgi:effector-binding domain-containing protein
MKALKIIGIVILALVAIFLIVSAFLPNSVTMQESMVIHKKADVIFKQVNNFQKWPAWSPWQKLDPQQVNKYEGPAFGVGAKTTWESKKNGNGSMTIVESMPYLKVSSSLDFGQKGGASNAFVFEEHAEGTLVTWSVNVPELGYPMGRYFGLIMPKMMKLMFTDGLTNLKTLTEGMPDMPEITETTLPEMTVLSILDSCSWSEIDRKMEQLYGELHSQVGKNRAASVSGYPFSAYYQWDVVNQTAVFEAGVPVSGEIRDPGRAVYKTMPAVKTVTGTHFGAYEDTEYLYNALDEYLLEHGLESAGGPLEMYLTDPVLEPDTAKWQTNVYFPVK